MAFIVEIVLTLVTAVAWVGCHYLLIYEYRKGLSETWSALKLFWTLNLFIVLANSIYKIREIQIGNANGDKTTGKI